VLHESIFESILEKYFKIFQNTLQKYFENTFTKCFSKVGYFENTTQNSIFYFENRNLPSEEYFAHHCERKAKNLPLSHHAPFINSFVHSI